MSPSETNKQITNNQNSDLTTCSLQSKVVLQSTPNSRLTPTTPIDSWNFPTPSVSNLRLLSPAQPGPSTSTPNSIKSLDFNGHCSKARRLSSFFQNEKQLNNFHYTVREVQYDSESD